VEKPALRFAKGTASAVPLNVLKENYV